MAFVSEKGRLVEGRDDDCWLDGSIELNVGVKTGCDGRISEQNSRRGRGVQRFAPNLFWHRWLRLDRMQGLASSCTCHASVIVIRGYYFLPWI